MGWHTCEFCPRESTGGRFKNTSSGDVTLAFTNGHVWVMPDMILHYVADHRWMPPKEFVADVAVGKLVEGGRAQVRDVDTQGGGRVGYLTSPPERRSIPLGLIDQLEELIQQAARTGSRAQTRGIS